MRLETLFPIFFNFLYNSELDHDNDNRIDRLRQTLPSRRSLEMLPLTKTIELEGVYKWEPMWGIDNRNNSLPITRTRKSKTISSMSYSSFVSSVQNYTGSLNFGTPATNPLQILGAFVNVGVSGGLNILLNNVVTKKEDKYTEDEQTDTLSCGPNSSVELYRRVFYGPGITIQTDVTGPRKDPDEKVPISVVLKIRYFLKDLQVVYTQYEAGMPDNAVKEYHRTDRIPNVNSAGKMKVWLVPVWTENAAEAASSVQFFKQDGPSPGLVDLSAGENAGKYRYLKLQRDQTSKVRIAGIGLSRHKTLFNAPQDDGWDECTEDLNKGLEYNYLYLCWNFVRA